MFEDDPVMNEVIDLLAEDEEMTLQQEAADVPECLRVIRAPTWMFIGQYAMPYSEHLIPFRN